MADDSAPAVHGAVAAVLAVMPTWDERVFIGTTQDARLPHRQNPTWDLIDSPAARAIAATCAATVLRAAADRYEAKGQHVSYPNTHIGKVLRAWADEIEPPKETNR